METIESLLDYVDTKRLSERLAVPPDKISHDDVRVAAIKILGWLKSQNRMATKRALPLNSEFNWCVNVATLLAEVPNLRTVFFATDSEFDFRPEINQETRNEIRAIVDARYRPPLMSLNKDVSASTSPRQ
jgi:hypothetical protein